MCRGSIINNQYVEMVASNYQGYGGDPMFMPLVVWVSV